MCRRHKIWIILFASLLTLLMIAVFLVQKNYELGKDLHHFANEVAYQCKRVVDSIDYFRQEYSISNDSQDEISRSRYDDALAQISLHFGIKDFPFLNDVRLEYYYALDALRQKTRSDEELKKVITGEETSIDIDSLQNQLKIVVNTLNDFDKRYAEMSEWERYFTSWERVREELTETVRIPET